MCTPETKEIRFFDKDRRYNKGIEFYEEFFEDCRCYKAIGEASPPYWNKGITLDKNGNYSYNSRCDAPQRINKHYPDIKVIFTLRNPVDRLYSQFWKNKRQGREESDSVVNAIKEELDGERHPRKNNLCWIYRNSYAKHLSQWKRMYNDTNIKVIIFEEWTNNVEQTIKSIYGFLGVDETVSVEYDKHKNKSRTLRSTFINKLRDRYIGQNKLGKVIRWLNEREGRPQPSMSERKWLFDILKSQIEKTEAILGRSLSVWYPR